MTPWQILQASRAASAARDFYSQHGGGGPLRCSSAAAATVDGCSSFYLSRGRMALQDLNGRLAWYLQQVRNLEASNERLEIQIKRELNRRCPSERRPLDKHLRTVSLLQQRIHEDLAVQAQLKLQLLNAELNIAGLKLRCDHEDKRGRVVHEQLTNLWQLWEDLQVQLPQLEDHLNHMIREMIQMQSQHQEDTQYLQAQISGAISIDTWPGQSSALTQQLDHLRWTNDMLFSETLVDPWGGKQGVQMSLKRPAVALNNHEDLEFLQLELEQLKRSAMSLEAELTHLEAQNEALEASGMELENIIDQDLLVLEEGEDLLCQDLNSVLQASAQQAEDHQILLGVKIHLENEIHDYRRLLEGLDQQWVPGFSSRFSNHFGTVTFPSTHHFTVNNMVSSPRRRIYMKEIQQFPGNFTPPRQTASTPVFKPVVSTIQPIEVQDKLPNNSRSSRVLTLNAETRRSVSAGGQSEDQESPVVCVQEIQSLDEGVAVRKSIASLSVPETWSTATGQTATDECQVQTQLVTTRTFTQPNQTPKNLTRLSLYELSKQTPAEENNKMTITEFPQKNRPKDATQSPDQDHGQTIPVTLKIGEEAHKTVASDTVKSFCSSVEAAVSVSGHVVPIDQIGVVNQGSTKGTILEGLQLDSQLSRVSIAEQNKITKAAAEGSSSALAPAITSDRTKVKLELVPSEFPAKSSDILENSESCTSTQSITEACLLDNKTERDKEELETAPKTNLTQGLAENQFQGPEAPISLKIQSETDINAEIVAGTGSCVSGSVSQSTTSVEATLTYENNAEKHKEVQVQTVVIREGQGSTIELNKALANKEKQTTCAPTEALRYEDVGYITECTTSSETFSQANGPDTNIRSVVTKRQREEKLRATPVPQLEDYPTKQAQLENESEAVVLDQVPDPANQGEFLSFESFQSLRRPKPSLNTLWLVLRQDLSEDVGDEGQDKEDKLHIAELKVTIGEVKTHSIFKKDDEHSQSFSPSQCLQDRLVTTLVRENDSPVLNATTNSCRPSGQESGHQLNGILDGTSQSVMVRDEQKLPANGTSGNVFAGEAGKIKAVQNQGAHPGSLSAKQEIWRTQAPKSEPSQVQTVSVSEESKNVFPGQEAQTLMASIPELSEKGSTDQTELLLDNLTEDSEKVLTDQSGAIQTTSIAEESETASPDQTAELQTVSIPDQSEEAIIDQTEYPTVNTIKSSEKVLELKTVSITYKTGEVLSDPTVHLQTLSVPEESKTVFADQTAELKTTSVPKQSKEPLIDQTEFPTVNIKETNEKVLTDETVQLQTLSIPVESEKVLTDQRTGLNDTNGGLATSNEDKTSLVRSSCEGPVALKAKVTVDDHRELKLNAGRPTGPNLTTSPSKDTKDSNGMSSARRQEESLVFNSKPEKSSSLMKSVTERSLRRETEPSDVSTDKGRFSGEDWIVYGGGLGLNRTRSADSLSTVTPPSLEIRTGCAVSKDQLVDRGSPKISNGTKSGDSLHNAESTVGHANGSPKTSNLGAPVGRFSHEEWKVYGGGSPGRIRSWKSSDSLGKDEAVATLTKIALPGGPVEPRRLGSAASDEWRVYGGSTERISQRSSSKGIPKTVKEEVLARGAQRTESPEPLKDLGETGVSVGTAGRVSNWVSSSIRPAADKEVTPVTSGQNPPTSTSGSQVVGRLGSGHSGEWRVYGGSAGRLSRSSSADQVSIQAGSHSAAGPNLKSGSAGSSSGMSSGSHRISTSGRYASTGSVERKPVYSPASVRKNSAGSGSKLSGQSGARISNSSRPGTTSATGGRVIISSSRPIRSTGSGVGDNKERISVCKMAALSIAAAGRGRGQDQQKP